MRFICHQFRLDWIILKKFSSISLNWSKAMLFLSSYFSNPPQLIGESGPLPTLFSIDDHEVYYSCAVTHANNHYIFGGFEKKRQVLQVANCGLVTIGVTPFEVASNSACGAMGNLIIVCFNTHRLCRFAPSPLGQWSEMPLSNFIHKSTSIGTSTGTCLLFM